MEERKEGSHKLKEAYEMAALMALEHHRPYSIICDALKSF
jgi:hypothetical protein